MTSLADRINAPILSRVAEEACNRLCLALVIGISAGVVVLLVVVVIIFVFACRRGKSRCCERDRRQPTDSTPNHATVVTVGKLSGDYSEIPNVANVAYVPTPTPSTTQENPDYLHFQPSDPPADPDYLHLPETATVLTTL